MGKIKKIFKCVVKGDFGELVRLWLQDLEVAKKKEKHDLGKKTRHAVSLISKGLISNATNRMISHGVASLDGMPFSYGKHLLKTCS